MPLPWGARVVLVLALVAGLARGEPHASDASTTSPAPFDAWPGGDAVEAPDLLRVTVAPDVVLVEVVHMAGTRLVASDALALGAREATASGELDLRVVLLEAPPGVVVALEAGGGPLVVALDHGGLLRVRLGADHVAHVGLLLFPAPGASPESATVRVTLAPSA